MKVVSVEDQYNKFSSLKKEDVAHLMEWIQKQPHLPSITELEMLLFLHSCYNGIELTKTTIDIYYTTRTIMPDFFKNRDILDKSLQNLMDISIFMPLDQLTPQGYKVIYFKLVDSTVSKFDFSVVIKLFCIVADLWLLEEGAANGHMICFDMDKFVFGHMTRLNPITVKKFLYYLQEAMPVRVKGIHIINPAPFFNQLLALLKPFLKKELLDELHFHTDIKNVFPYIQQDALPSDYGGSFHSIKKAHEISYNRVKENRKFFMDEEKTRRVNEKLRRGQTKVQDDMYGLDGSFKKLAFD